VGLNKKFEELEICCQCDAFRLEYCVGKTCEYVYAMGALLDRSLASTLTAEREANF